MRWVRENDRGIVFGIEFDRTNGLAQELRNFLNIGQIGKRMRVIKNDDFSLEIPGNLKYWLRSDGPGEIFFWQHSDGELSKIQLLFLDKLVEWVDGEGVRTGSLVENNNIETPLFHKEEILFDMDETLDLESLGLARDLVNEIPSEIVPESILKFLNLKLGH